MRTRCIAGHPTDASQCFHLALRLYRCKGQIVPCMGTPLGVYVFTIGGMISCPTNYYRAAHFVYARSLLPFGHRTLFCRRHH